MKRISILSARTIKTVSTAALFGAIMLPVSTVPAKANDVVADFEHAIMCLGLLVSDPAKHLEICGVNDNKVVNLNIANSGTDPVPAEEEETQPEEDNPPQEDKPT